MGAYQKELINSAAEAILDAGFRVFIADSGTYGFFTDVEGSRVISIGSDLCRTSVSGNYKTDKPGQTGNGWRIADDFDPSNVEPYFDSYPPRRAVGDSNWKFTTLEQHLATYQKSSKYKEVLA